MRQQVRTKPSSKSPAEICQLAKMFPYHHTEYGGVADYGPAFVEAASLVEAACAGFAPPG